MWEGVPGFRSLHFEFKRPFLVNGRVDARATRIVLVGAGVIARDESVQAAWKAAGQGPSDLPALVHVAADYDGGGQEDGGQDDEEDETAQDTDDDEVCDR